MNITFFSLTLAIGLQLQAQNGDKLDPSHKDRMEKDVVPDDQIPPVRLLSPSEALADLSG